MRQMLQRDRRCRQSPATSASTCYRSSTPCVMFIHATNGLDILYSPLGTSTTVVIIIEPAT